MRKLLFLFVCALVSIGASAYTLDLAQTWTVDGVTEKVAKINLQSAGELASALSDLNSQMTDYSHLYISNGAGFDLAEADITALGTVTCPTLDLQNLYGTDGDHHAPFTFSNASIKRVILPDYWDKAAVKAAAQAIAAVNTNFEAALSQHGQQNQSTADAKLVAYVQKPGTLYTAMRHTFFNSRADKKMGNATQSYVSFDKLGYVSIMGYPSALDFNGNANASDVKFDPNGHFVFDREADETSVSANAGIGGTRALTGTAHNGAISGADLIQLDLGDAVIYEEWCNDITLSWSYVIGNRTKEIIFPTNTELKTIPADCLNTSLPLLEEICIPGNIENLKTRSFWISNQVLRHVWTTGTTEHMRYDNGAYLRSNHDEPDHYGHAPLDDENWNNGKANNSPARYGTITLPENLKLIESHVFTSRSVSDVYVLAKVAPECHVDAFSTIMYIGNNTIDTQYTANQGMITRWSYAQGDANAEYITFLHYPRECGTPEIQRYTDPTREYSVATTWRDGKGNVVYFPNQSEFNRAYIQGTTGYLWFAWDSERVPEPAGNANSFANANPATSGGHTTDLQQTANDLYIANTMTDPDKTDRSFYDVRLNTDGQPSLTKPSDLDWYYNTVWEGKYLYPEMETSTSTEKIGEVQSQDSEGHLLYETCSEGSLVQDYSYVQDNAGDLYWDRVVTENANGNYVKDYDYEEAADGEYYHPFVKETNKDEAKCAAGVYYYNNRTERYDAVEEGESGDYINPYGSYVLISDVRNNWHWSEDQIAAYTQYVLVVTNKWVHLTSTSQDGYAFWNKDVYYVSEGYATYDATGVVAGVNETRYSKVYSEEYRAYNASTDEGEQRYDVVDNGLRAYNSATDTDNSKRYNKVYKDYTYREFDSSKDAADEPRYCPVMEDVYAVVKGKQNDYRGWHQFVLHAYDTNDDRPIEPVKFYQTDNDWWTVCLPYDLKYSEMIRFFGNGDSNIPYLSKLRYVVRDYDQKKITLMFSQNLMVYKEDIQNPSNTDDYVHGIIDDNTQYTADELADDPVILHKGVPYLIRPNIDVNAGRSFDVYKNGHAQANADLYQRLVDSRNVPAAQLETDIYKGEYTVPAYVVGESIPEATVATRSFAHAAGPTFVYSSDNPITYQGKQIYPAISNDYSYTFVGTYFLSVLPQYCYFLGWDSKNSRAAFWYNRVPNLASQDWNNQTGIICPNFNTSKTIDPATSLSDPARWIFAASDVKNDDLVGVSAGSKYNTLGTMDWGGTVDVVVDGIGSIQLANPQSIPATEVAYDLQGVRMNQPLERLPKGVYIVNGKKYVVK